MLCARRTGLFLKREAASRSRPEGVGELQGDGEGVREDGRWEHLLSPAHLSPPGAPSSGCSIRWRHGFPPGSVTDPLEGHRGPLPAQRAVSRVLCPVSCVPCPAGAASVLGGCEPHCCVGPETEAGLGEGCSEHLRPRRGRPVYFTVSLQPRRCLPRSGRVSSQDGSPLAGWASRRRMGPGTWVRPPQAQFSESTVSIWNSLAGWGGGSAF